ncbi:hypothetical protein [Clostridium beijerinckii]|uniref:Uncharacterized protein n=2 Tax=Clostridium beijerinckii TaxID=1520 RepID=A0AAW3W6D0_CLOBE|nr:hypothetical protein [Clostridium beijerinckii]MBC2457170.1 hypothetical protein [Clostridium beijerinckii]MBC2474226.1 hypothetical protein [Clostridium beijerinckii]NOW32030.1 hypothetical protein [Clostridium beijerinckii]
MKVTELSQGQLSELKMNYYYGEDEDDGHEAEYACPDDVPNEVIFKHYADIDFVNDDFGCSQGDDDGEED